MFDELPSNEPITPAGKMNKKVKIVDTSHMWE